MARATIALGGGVRNRFGTAPVWPEPPRRCLLIPVEVSCSVSDR